MSVFERFQRLLKNFTLVNQPTVLMRRACEVAVGNRPRRKPFVETSYSADSEKEISRYASEDDWGNCCYHFEKKTCDPVPTCHPSISCPGNCVPAKCIPEKNCYYYCC
ncbi:unnamed protein product [Leptidea sinapis]|uniref:Uncharacterized protein n=1 Tax=Leptidea sinapis TaxID=189913 RepID=A0A5E4QLK2_9NEOP|nr:unnamed protein product [Leptidea sinapis]